MYTEPDRWSFGPFGLLAFLVWSAVSLHVCFDATAYASTPWCSSTPIVPEDEFSVLVMAPPTEEELLVIDAVAEGCRHYGPHADPFELLALYRLEKSLGVHEWRPALLLGVFCVEAGLRTTSRRGGPIWGDYRDGVPMAWGPMQLWKTSRDDCRGTPDAAHDLIWSGRCWVARTERVLDKASRFCDKNQMMVAEAAISNIRKYGWRCNASSEHWKTADAIWRSYERHREARLSVQNVD